MHNIYTEVFFDISASLLLQLLGQPWPLVTATIRSTQSLPSFVPTVGSWKGVQAAYSLCSTACLLLAVDMSNKSLREVLCMYMMRRMRLFPNTWKHAESSMFPAALYLVCMRMHRA